MVPGYQSFNSNNHDDCIDICKNNTGCTGWTFLNKTCRLHSKDACALKLNDSNIISDENADKRICKEGKCLLDVNCDNNSLEFKNCNYNIFSTFSYLKNNEQVLGVPTCGNQLLSPIIKVSPTGTPREIYNKNSKDACKDKKIDESCSFFDGVIIPTEIGPGKCHPFSKDELVCLPLQICIPNDNSTWENQLGTCVDLQTKH